jgi:putative Mg2+ transporter-C (MgtC) family protein
MEGLLEDLLKLIVAIVVGGLIGAEREYRYKAVGFRTMIFISVGSTLFTIFSMRLGGTQDPVPIAASIVTGIGFLGAGVILRHTGKIMGLTTASTIWLAAALGVGIGGGQFLLTGLATAGMLIVLWFFPLVEKWIHSVQDTRTYEVICAVDMQAYEDLAILFTKHGLHVRDVRRMKQGEDMVCTWEVSGSHGNYERLIDNLFLLPVVKEFRV